MNFHVVKYLCGQVLKFLAAFMVLSLLVALIYREYRSALVFGVVIAGLFGLGFLLTVRKPANTSFYAREGIVTVSLSWILISVFGSLPFYLTGAVTSFIDSLFETISGFTTTGSSILADVEVMEKGLLFWRSFTHWVGGMGVLMFVMAILPMSGADPLFMMRAESPGPTTEKLVPKAQQTAKILYTIYISMTFIEIIMLVCGGMPLYDSVVHSLASAGTGGFSIKNQSIGYYDSVYCEVVISVFTVLFGINFSAYFLLLAKQFKKFLTFEEMLVYFGIIAVSIIIITINLTLNAFGSIWWALRHSSFQVSTIITTTGFASTNFDLWPTLSKFVLIFLMFIGACAGSTGGGIKVSRFIIIFKALKREAGRILHPKSVSFIKLDKVPVAEGVVGGTGLFMVIMLCIYAISVLIVSLDGFDMVTTGSAVAACLNNIGPGLGMVGPMGNYSEFSNLSKIVLFTDMLIGRLELYPVLLLLSPSLWRMKG